MPSLSQLYRPRRFADVTGQQHVTDTLRAELATGHLGHAFLFSGPRGVGKTTCARILAKTLGCASPQGGEPCESCPSCQQFLEGRSLDVIEIDAATHTGVDMIREAIIEHVRFAPVGKRKVYILDEAHMLSTASWNALLKTLEEPPSYAFFVFATTEWHKVPPTILSRCQRFEFRRIQDGDMVTRLRDLAERQSWKVEAEVFPLIASRAEGCLRDAETLLAQVGALAEDGVISFATAGLVIPVSSMDQALRWLELVAGRASQEANEQVLAWQDAGVSFTTLFDDVLELIKRLLQAQAGPSLLKGWEQGTAEDRRLALLVKRWTGQELRAQALELMDRRRDLKSGMDPVFVALLAWQMVTASAPSVSMPSVSAHLPPTAPASAPKSPAPVVAPVLPVVMPAVSVPASESVPATPVIVPVSPEPLSPPAPIPEPAPAPVSGPVVPAPAVEAAAPVMTGGAIDIVEIRRRWNGFIRAVEAKNHSLPFILKISKPERVDGTMLIIRFPYPFHRDKVITDGKNLRLITECAREAFGYPTLTVDGIVVTPEASEEAGTSGDVASSIMKAFGGTVVETPS